MRQASQPMVLVVDDDPDLLNAVSFSLRAEGFMVRACGDCAAAMEAAADCAPDCLVIDYRLPEMDGLRLGARLRDMGAGAPLVIITSHPDRQCRRAVERADAVIVEKPLLGDVLRDQIQRLLQIA